MQKKEEAVSYSGEGRRKKFVIIVPLMARHFVTVQLEG